MQSVYAILQSKSDNLDKEEKFLFKSIDNMYELYAILLRLLVEVKNLEIHKINIAKKKHLATSEELSPNTKFINNQVIKLLTESASLNNYLEITKSNCWVLDGEYVAEIWKLMKENKHYLAYMESSTSSFNEDREFVIKLFKKVVAPNDKLADYFEDKTISWADDIPFVNTWIVKSLNKLKPQEPFQLGELYKDETDKQFVVDLFRKVVLNHDKFEQEIFEKTPNWDTDRIAEIDMILMKMAICEFLKFPSIPTHVTINEYIEIAKDYSTEKSSFFINGVLDKVLKDLTAAKRLQKIGRGLL